VNVYRYYQKIPGRGTYWLFGRNEPAIHSSHAAAKEVGWEVIESEMEDGVICIPVDNEGPMP
jgi:hypothetical protein